MLSRFISARGLFEFVLDGLSKDTVIDVGAMRGMLEETNELRKTQRQKCKRDKT